MRSIQLLLIAASCFVSPMVITAQTPVQLRTFTNCASSDDDLFGRSVAALGSDRVLAHPVAIPFTPIRRSIFSAPTASCYSQNRGHQSGHW